MIPLPKIYTFGMGKTTLEILKYRWEPITDWTGNAEVEMNLDFEWKLSSVPFEDDTVFLENEYYLQKLVIEFKAGYQRRAEVLFNQSGDH